MTTEINASTATASATPAVAEVKVTTMSVAKSIYATISANTELTHPRKAFIEQLMSQTGATKKCASSYYQMNRTAAAGGKLYKHHTTAAQRAEKQAAKVEPIARAE